MKFSCTRDNLHQALSITSHLTSKNVNLPVLQNVLVKAQGGAIKFTTTNLEMAIHCLVRGKVDQEGEVTIPSKLFFEFASLLPNENVQIETEEDLLHVVCGNNQTKINGLPATEFPLVPSVESSWSVNIPVETFRRALSQVLFAVATNESRPELTGVSMQFQKTDKGSILTMATTDSYRLAESTIGLDQGPTEEKKLIIPERTLNEISRILSIFKDSVESPSEIIMKVSDSQVVFSYGTVELISRTIEGTYPDYTQIIPKQFQTESILDRDDFIKSVKAASLFSKTGLFDVSLFFDPDKKELSVRAVDSTRGENTARCTADVTGQENTVTVNYRYLLDGLNAMSTDKILFQMIDAANPCLVTPQKEDSGYLYIVMPIKQ
ncbi:DNA polymerase III subunit beta [Patescibacteria group bacterium]